jgi:anti-anti-sigma factor
MEMQIALVENVAHVKLRGRLDTHGVDEIETKLTASVVPGGKNTIVDLSDVSFVTSMGLRMFLGISKALKRHNAKMVLFAPQPQASEVFASAYLSSIIPIVGNEAEALALVS